MEHPLSASIFLPFFILYFVVRGYWGAKAVKRPVEQDKSFFMDKVNIGLQNLFVVVFPLLALFTNALSMFDYPENPALIWLSIPFFLSGVILVWLSHRDLAENWSVTLELKKGHSLVTSGIYRHIRHPMYLAIWLFLIGQALCIPNYLAGPGAPIAWAVLYFMRIEKEEQMMIEKFGDEYRSYMARTKRLIPWNTMTQSRQPK